MDTRYFPFAMVKNHELVLEFIKLVDKILTPYRPVGLLQEEPEDEYVPEKKRE